MNIYYFTSALEWFHGSAVRFRTPDTYWYVHLFMRYPDMPGPVDVTVEGRVLGVLLSRQV
jgi:hypothetical protein